MNKKINFIIFLIINIILCTDINNPNININEKIDNNENYYSTDIINNCEINQIFDDINKKCICKENWYNSTTCLTYCDEILTCSDHGECDDNGFCLCDNGYYGDNCNITCPGFIDNNSTIIECYGNGICNDGICECYSGYLSPNCTCDNSICMNGGFCETNTTCHCYKNYFGPFCEIECTRDKNCSGHGECHEETGNILCDCDDGYYHDTCTKECSIYLFYISCKYYMFRSWYM